MARSTYLGTANDLIWGSAGPGASPRVPSKDVTLTFWDAQTGGTQHTDLLLDGAPVSEVVIAAADLPGTPAIQGPDGVNDGMWVQAQIVGATTTDRREFILPWPTSGGGTGGAVDSVNGQTGAVTLSAADVGALPASTTAASIGAETPAAAQSKADAAEAAAKAYADSRAAALVDTAPGVLDTLNELAAALGDDPNFATTVSGQIAGKVDGSDPRLSDARTPLAHTHTSDDVTDFAAAVQDVAGAHVVLLEPGASVPPGTPVGALIFEKG